MPQVSFPAQVAFVALVVAVAFAFIIAVRRAGDSKESNQTTLRWISLAALIVMGWLGVSALVAESEVLLEFERRPPPFLIFAFTFVAATAALAFSPVGTRLVNGVSIGWLVGFQAFRIPVELWLHWLYREGVVPVQMTYAGRNYDIITGVLALLIGLWALKQQPPRWAIWLFNLIGLALLINIVTVAIMSTPTPMRRFFNEPANTFVAYVPYVWLPAFLVQAAWFGHLLVFRWLRRTNQ